LSSKFKNHRYRTSPVVPAEDAVVPDSGASVVSYAFFTLVFLAVLAVLFAYCGGRERLRRWMQERELRRKRDGYQAVPDLEK